MLKPALLCLLCALVPWRTASTQAFDPARADPEPPAPRHPMTELHPSATLHLGKTADWVAITDDALWVATTGPYGVARIDPATNAVAATVPLPGNPCAGLAVGFGGLWVPLCTKPASLARVDLRTREVTWVPGAGPAAREGGITVSDDAVWLAVGHSTLARIDPYRMRIRQRVTVPSGSLNPVYGDGLLWISRSTGRRVTAVDAHTGAVVGAIETGPRPRFLAVGEDSVWTLNQGDGTLTRIEMRSRRAISTTALRTPGPGGDVKVAQGVVWTTMMKVPLSATDAASGKLLCQWAGPGGDSLDVGHGALWLTDYTAGDVRRFDMQEILRLCPSAAHAGAAAGR